GAKIPTQGSGWAFGKGGDRMSSPALKGLNERLTLESFVVGSCNHMAFNAGIEALRRPGHDYNPLFIYGGSGLGKTHLLQALTREYFRNGLRKIRYLHCETFMNSFIKAVQDRTMERFRNYYRSLEVLVLDDVQILEKKERTQLELLHTLDILGTRRRQVIIASDSRPQDIRELQKQLQGRFVAGLVCRVEVPDYPTRLTILTQQAREAGAVIPEGVLHLIADSFHKNVRELSGALVRVVAFASLLKEPLTEARALDILEDQLWRERRGPTLDSIVRIVTQRFSVPGGDLRSRSRARTTSCARQVAIYLGRVLTEHSLAEIGEYFGGRNHATVNFSFRKVQKLMLEKREFQLEIEDLLRQLQV
ncbi:MAG: chromosomal replication initiator protein DnaA, partial [Planctomycetota bacterium]